jgi:hypothetical protein
VGRALESSAKARGAVHATQLPLKPKHLGCL